MQRLSVLIVVLMASPGWAYTEQPVTDGGHVSGKVILKGPPPPPKAFNLITYPETVFCGRISTGTIWRLLDQFQVSPDGGLQHAVVMLEGVHRGKPFPASSPTIEARDCTLTPPVMAVRNHQDLRIVNMDPIIHDIQVYEVAPFESEVMFHRPLRMNPIIPTPMPGPTTTSRAPRSSIPSPLPRGGASSTWSAGSMSSCRRGAWP